VVQEQLHDAERIGPAHAGQNGGVLHERQHFAGHLDDDLVGIAVRHHARQRPTAGHAEPARVVDDDEVDSARFGTLGADAGSRAAADDRSAGRDLGPQSSQAGLAVEYAHATESGVAGGVDGTGAFLRTSPVNSSSAAVIATPIDAITSG